MGRKKIVRPEDPGEAELNRVRNILSRQIKSIPEDQITGSKKPAKTNSGIYFLIKDDQIVYIGQSMNMLARIGSHATKLDFDSYSTIDCDQEFLDAVEHLFIKRFDPALNKNDKNFSYNPIL